MKDQRRGLATILFQRTVFGDQPVADRHLHDPFRIQSLAVVLEVQFRLPAVAQLELHQQRCRAHSCRRAPLRRSLDAVLDGIAQHLAQHVVEGGDLDLGHLVEADAW